MEATCFGTEYYVVRCRTELLTYRIPPSSHSATTLQPLSRITVADIDGENPFSRRLQMLGGAAKDRVGMAQGQSTQVAVSLKIGSSGFDVCVFLF